MPENGQNEKKRRLKPFQNGQSYEVVYSNSNRKTHNVNEHKSSICFQRSQGCNIHEKYVVVPAYKVPSNIARAITLIIKDIIIFG